MPAVLYEYCQRQDGTGTVMFVSASCLSMLGRPPSFFIGDVDRFMSIVHPDDLERFQEEDRRTVNDSEFATEARIILPTSETRWMRFTSKPEPGRSDNSDVFWSGCITDITPLKHAEKEVERLRGILQTCSYCKKIHLAGQDRTDSVSWVPIETYISDHSDAQFSHGLCPECFQKNYGEAAWREYLQKERLNEE